MKAKIKPETILKDSRPPQKVEVAETSEKIAQAASAQPQQEPVTYSVPMPGARSYQKILIINNYDMGYGYWSLNGIVNDTYSTNFWEWNKDNFAEVNKQGDFTVDGHSIHVDAGICLLAGMMKDYETGNALWVCDRYFQDYDLIIECVDGKTNIVRS